MTDSQRWMLMTALLLSAILLYLLAPILMPFMIGGVLAYIGDPLVDRLEERRLPRTAAVLVVFTVIVFVLALIPFVLLPILQQELSVLVRRLPAYLEQLQSMFLPWLESSFGLSLQGLDMAEIKRILMDNWQSAGGAATAVMASVSRSGLVLLQWMTTLVLVPVVTFYLLRDWDHLVAKVHSLIPRYLEERVVGLTKQADEVLGAFFRGQLLVMIALSFIYSVGLWMLGLEFALLIGLIAGVVSFVPYLGFVVGVGLAVVAALFQFHDGTLVFYVLLVFAVGQALESMLLTPLLVGDRIGLHPVAVIFAILAGGQLFGFVGVLVALPVAAVIMVLLRYAHQSYKISDLYSG